MYIPKYVIVAFIAILWLGLIMDDGRKKVFASFLYAMGLSMAGVVIYASCAVAYIIWEPLIILPAGIILFLLGYFIKLTIDNRKKSRKEEHERPDKKDIETRWHWVLVPAFLIIIWFYTQRIPDGY